MKGVTEDFLLFIVGVLALLIVLSTVFGRGIAYNIFGILANSEPTYFQENLRTILTEASFSPGEYEARIKMNVKHTITISNDTYPTLLVETKSPFNFTQPSPQAFLSNCMIVKTCSKNCSWIGDFCGNEQECCGTLSCDTTGHCASTYGSCWNGILDDGEECDPGNETGGIPPNDTDCKGLCQYNCKCTAMHIQCGDGIDNDFDGLIDSADPDCHYDHNAANTATYNKSISSEYTGLVSVPQCNDTIDNDGDTFVNIVDPDCHKDYNATNAASYDPNRYESRLEGEPCDSNNDCYRLLKCMSKVVIDKVGETLIVRKTVVNNMCEIEIEKV